MALNADQERVANRIAEIVTQKDSAGNFKFTKREVRDFLVATVLELRLEITPEVQGPMLEMLAEIQVPEDATDEQIAEAIHAYYAENPVNPELYKEIEALGRDETLAGAKGYKDRGEQMAALKSVGGGEKLEAPEHKPKSRKIPMVKRGLK